MTTTAPVPVLLMSRELGSGGSERQLAATALALDPRRYRAHAGCFHAGFRAEELRSAGIPVIEFPVRSFASPGAVNGAWALTRYLRQQQIRVVHTFDYPMNSFAVPVARAASVPVVLSSQRSHRGLTPRLYRGLLRISDRLADGIVVNCEAVREHLASDEHIGRNKMWLCYNGIDTSVFHAAGRKRVDALRGAAVVIGAVGVLRQEKGLFTLLEAFARVEPERRRLTLAIVGSGPLKRELESRSQTLGIRQCCVFEPATPDVAEWMRSIDVFVLPSLSEALSNSLMEAMACGCTAVASRTGGNVELVRDGETGFMFTPGSADELAARLVQLVADESLRKSLGDAASRFIPERFPIAGMARRMEEIYGTLLNRRQVL